MRKSGTRLIVILRLIDVVYTEEIVDRKLLDTKRYINKDFGTIGKPKACILCVLWQARSCGMGGHAEKIWHLTDVTVQLTFLV